MSITFIESTKSCIKSWYASFKDNQEYILKKVLPTSLMFLITIFIYSIVRGAKDTLLIPVLGAEALPTVKLFGVLPSAISLSWFTQNLLIY